MYKSRSTYVVAAVFTAVIVVAVCAAFVSPAALWGDMGKKSISIRDNFNPGSLNRWDMPFPQDWQILKDGNLHYLHMNRSRPPGIPRRPLQFARLKGIKVGSFTLNLKVRRTNHSMIVVFGYVDTLHFYYVHLSENPGTQIAVHNGIFIVDGGPRRRIAGMDAAPALPDHTWHNMRIVRNIRTGSIKVYMDKQSTPRFSVIDRTFTYGQVGLGSFDEMGDFAGFRLRSKDVQSASAGTE